MESRKDCPRLRESNTQRSFLVSKQFMDLRSPKNASKCLILIDHLCTTRVTSPTRRSTRPLPRESGLAESGEARWADGLPASLRGWSSARAPVSYPQVRWAQTPQIHPNHRTSVGQKPWGLYVCFGFVLNSNNRVILQPSRCCPSSGRSQYRGFA